LRGSVLVRCGKGGRRREVGAAITAIATTPRSHIRFLHLAS